MIEEQKIQIEPAIAPEALSNYQELLDKALPILPLKNIVVLPTSIVPIIVGRKSSVIAVEHKQVPRF